jgi:hypothetical protein
VHDARHEPLEELLLAEHDHGLVLDAAGEIVEARGRLRRAHEPRQEERTAREEPAGDRKRGGKR